MSRLPSRIDAYEGWLQTTHGLRFDDYEALWRWSVTDLDAFWASIWAYFDLQSPTPRSAVLDGDRMPGARWFPGAQTNFAQQALRHADAAHAGGHPAIVYQNERLAAPATLSWPELQQRVAACANALQALGVQPGDRVVAWLPNSPATAVAFLACASLGAVWSVCSPDMGPLAVLDRFRQIEPRVLIAVDGQTWGGKAHDRRPVLRELLDGLPSVEHLVLVPELDPAARAGEFTLAGLATHDWPAWLAAQQDLGFAPRWLPFDHPLWIVYSSGTTGLPKPIVHGHGGVVLEFLKSTLLDDIGASVDTGDRLYWISSTGWIMWNAQMGGLLTGTTICLYDGHPAGQGGQDWSRLWRFVADSGATTFGGGAAFFASCQKAGLRPQQVADLSRLRALGATGSPLSEDTMRWLWDVLPRPGGQLMWINSKSGGTDLAGGFVSGHRGLPQVPGEIQCRCLGAAVEAWNERGQPVIDEVGELVCTRPMPSMPLYLWNDPDGRRYHDSYFDMFDGIWRHGDWIRVTPRGSAIIYGRSDATINRHGIRMGTAELYRAVEALPEVLDSLVVDLEYLGRPSWMPLFVVLRDGHALDEPMVRRIKTACRQALSPRHVPDDVFQVGAVPRTLSGKKMELPVKKL
ncbi:MAG: acetoacetate--CoA ligase, partial [Rubrivivax sp.]|nr:acetoacetate--CoA ligase [Rubrivivax sp.]